MANETKINGTASNILIDSRGNLCFIEDGIYDVVSELSSENASTNTGTVDNIKDLLESWKQTYLLERFIGIFIYFV